MIISSCSTGERLAYRVLKVLGSLLGPAALGGLAGAAGDAVLQGDTPLGLHCPCLGCRCTAGCAPPALPCLTRRPRAPWAGTSIGQRRQTLPPHKNALDEVQEAHLRAWGALSRRHAAPARQKGITTFLGIAPVGLPP